MKNKKNKNKKNKIKKKVQSTVVRKAVPVYRSVLYLLPEDTTAVELCRQLEFLPEESLEVWPELNILEITVESRTITFESLKEELVEEDLEQMERLSMKQIYTCEYAEEDRSLMQKVMQTLSETFGGKIGSDTEDFEPFLQAEEL